ncbi:MAG: PA14 domain-containing protein [Pirellulaceae bacterium]
MFLLASCSQAAGQEFDEEAPEYLNGLVATFESQGESFKRIDEAVQLDAANTQVDQRLRSGAFVATWRGLIAVKEDGTFNFSYFGSGTLEVEIANTEVIVEQTQEAEGWFQSSPVELSFGRHPIRVRYAGNTSNARIRMFWSGPTFETEPVEGRHLFFSTADLPESIRIGPTLGYSNAIIEDGFENGRQLSRGLRCDACHSEGNQLGANRRASLPRSLAPLVAPALDQLRGNIRSEWIIDHLTTAPDDDDATLNRKMPYLALSREEAATIAKALLATSKPGLPKSVERPENTNKRRKKKVQPEPLDGPTTFASVGCLACHAVESVNSASRLEEVLFGGVELSNLAAKRPHGFAKRWLSDPEAINRHHRMPEFELSQPQLDAIESYLLGTSQEPASANAPNSDTELESMDQATLRRARDLVEKHQCGACHLVPNTLLRSALISDTNGGESGNRGTRPVAPLTANSDWNQGCLTATDRSPKHPSYALLKTHRESLRRYYSERVPPDNTSDSNAIASRSDFIVESNCLGCHSRGEKSGIAMHLAQIAEAFPGTTARLAALTPPALTGIGDKLEDEALESAVRGSSPKLRDWLDVQMPKFRRSQTEAHQLARTLIRRDRIPNQLAETPQAQPTRQPSSTPPTALAQKLAGGQLVTATGFGCQSCHQIGDHEAPKVDLKARGTNLASLRGRIREPWFHRWVRNPSRIVPRMEMPAVQTAAKGLLNDSLDAQLDALWFALSAEDFQPPRPFPARTVRSFNDERPDQQANIVTSVIETPEKKFLRPIAVGLPNRHNVMFDLESGSWAGWWIGDTAHQHTRGKTWYWELGSPRLSPPESSTTALQSFRIVDADGQVWKPTPVQQVALHLDEMKHERQLGGGGVRIHGRLQLLNEGASIERSYECIVQQLPVETPVGGSSGLNGLRIESSMELLDGEELLLGTFGGDFQSLVDSEGNQELSYAIGGHSQITLRPFESRQEAAVPTTDSTRFRWTTTLTSSLPAGTIARPTSQLQVGKSRKSKLPTVLDCVPGFETIRLPLPRTEMPISFAWDGENRLYVGSLKGHVLRVDDLDRDSIGDHYEVISDTVPTPFGLHWNDGPIGSDRGSLDVLAKYALLRMTPAESVDENRKWNTRIIADGWGYSADYHDWAIGLEKSSAGEYLIALPCQQDDRSDEAAFLRGHAVRLLPTAAPDSDSKRLFELKSFAAGLRFPIGIALNSQGNLFTSDNQGNYNPFNEINYLQAGKRYGFINKLENKDGFSPTFEEPAINIPHPWTRSVNGICFLDVPAEQGRTPVQSSNVGKLGRDQFGPFEGHLIGCEMNGRRLIRMSLEKVNGIYQGAAYDFSLPDLPPNETFEGPIACEVAPNGDLYVGNLQDSGWSAGQNTGSIVRIRLDDPKELPVGIAEVQALSDGFNLVFTQPVDMALAGDPKNYQIRSYRRQSTPAYGGDDLQSRTEIVSDIEVAKDRKSAALKLKSLRAGFVYEIYVDAIGPGKERLFPRSAHYTLKTIPTD